MYPASSAHAKIYALPKVHKITPSNRYPKLGPIVSSCITAS